MDKSMTGDGAVVRADHAKATKDANRIMAGKPIIARECVNLARAYLAQAAEIERLTRELREVDVAFGNPSALDDCKTRRAKICHMFREIEMLSTAGIIEVAVRNMNVRHYMNHWEGRTEKAEARTADLLKALERYGVHKEPCRELTAETAKMFYKPRCICGLDDAIKAAKGETV